MPNPTPTVSNIDIRPAEASDAKTLFEMIRALATGLGQQDQVTSTPQDFRRQGFGEDRLFDALIAERAATPIGLCLFFFTFSTWLGEPGIYVQDLYVDPGERGHGVGQQLLAAAAAQGLARNASHLRLSVEATNEAAQGFYSHLGMQFREQERTYHLGKEAFRALAGTAQ